MAEAQQCPNGGKFYPDFVDSLALFRDKQGQITTGGVKGLGIIFFIGLMVVLAATLGVCLVRDISAWLIVVLYVIGGIIAVPAIVSLVTLIRQPVVGYEYHCKNCGKTWRTELKKKE